MHFEVEGVKDEEGSLGDGGDEVSRGGQCRRQPLHRHPPSSALVVIQDSINVVVDPEKAGLRDLEADLGERGTFHIGVGEIG